jgi:NitT/TauT family transport system substrate-binding protein
MDYPRTAGWNRWAFLHRVTLVGATGLLGGRPKSLAAEPPPETTRLRLHKMAGISIARQYVAEEFLHLEGFTAVRYVSVEVTELTTAIYRPLASGAVDISMAFAPPCIIEVDGGPIVFLGGHVDCFELFWAERVRAIHDLKGKTVAVSEQGGVPHLFLASTVRYVGLDARKDINWVLHPPGESI